MAFLYHTESMFVEYIFAMVRLIRSKPTTGGRRVNAVSLAFAAIFAVAGSGCQYNGSSLADVTAVGGPPEKRLAPSYGLNVAPENRLRTADERRQLQRDLEIAANAQSAQVGVGQPRRPSGSLQRAGSEHYEAALSEIEQQSSAPYTPPDCDNVDQNPNTEC